MENLIFQPLRIEYKRTSEKGPTKWRAEVLVTICNQDFEHVDSYKVFSYGKSMTDACEWLLKQVSFQQNEYLKERNKKAV